MAKRYHNGMKVSRSDYGINFHEDMSAPSNLPREVVYKYWPASPYSPMGMVDDLFEGAQKQMSNDRSGFGKIMDPKKY